MEQDGQVSGTACLVGQPGKIINFICMKISDHMEPSQAAFTIPSQLSKQAGPLPYSGFPLVGGDWGGSPPPAKILTNLPSLKFYPSPLMSPSN